MALKRLVIFLHRWLGVALCLLFLLWFPSGIGMMYWDFPEVTAEDRLARSAALDPATIRLSPVQAFAALHSSEVPSDIRLTSFDRRPLFRFIVGAFERSVYADTGELRTTASPEQALRVASAWAGQPPQAATMETVVEADQWTVPESFRADRPMTKYSWPTGEQVYVAQASGGVVQFTTTASRLGAYLGPIPHWLYFTPLRKHQAAWTALVVWSSGFGAITALLGLIVGVSVYSSSGRIPYRGQKRWHTIFGLTFGVGAVTWAFSGMLSMDPFPVARRMEIAARGGPASRLAAAFRSQLDLSRFAAFSPRDAIARLADLPVKEVAFVTFAGEPVYLAELGGGDTRIVTLDGQVHAEFDRRRIIELATQAAAPAGLSAIHVLDRYDAYYLDRHRRRPLPAILAELNDSEHTRYYIDPKTARIVGSYSSRNWATRWLYHGLHSLNVPWLYEHRPLWDIVVITFMLGGTAIAVTSLVLAWRVVGRALLHADPGDRSSTSRPPVALSRSTPPQG